MAKPISTVKNAVNILEFDRVPKRLYTEDSPPLKRVFEIPEKWLIVEGDLSFMDDYTKQILAAKTGDIIDLPQNSAFSKMQFTQPSYIKQYVNDEKERNKISTNIKINYLIIQTILEIIDQYDEFTGVPFETNWLFECAKERMIGI